MSILKSFAFILSKKQKKFFFLLFFLIICATILELFGVGLILPITALVLDPNSVGSLPRIGNFIESNFDLKSQSFFYYAIGFTLLIYILKNTYLIFFNWSQSNFIFKIQLELSKELFEGYLKMPYSFFLKTNSSIIIRNIVNEVNILTNTLQSLVILLSEVFIFSAISILLVIIEPKATIIIVFIFGFSAFIFYKINDRRIKHWGITRQNADSEKIKSVQEAIKGIKEIRIYKSEKFFLDSFYENCKKSCDMAKKINFLSSIPRQWFEVLAVFTITILFYILRQSDYSGSEVFSILALFAVASFRLMPSINKILGSIQLIIYNLPVINLLREEFTNIRSLSKPTNKKLENMKFEGLEIKDMSFEYEPGKPILENVNLRIEKNDAIGIMGPSGSGKTTFINILMGLIKPTSGTISINDKPLTGQVDSWQSIIGYVSQNIFMLDDSILSNIKLNTKTYDEKKIDRIINDVKLDNLLIKLNKGLFSKVGESGSNISGGQVQRVAIARALYKGSQILIFDEPTSALDEELEKEISKLLEKLKSDYTIIVISHRTEILKFCNKVLKLQNGSFFNNSNKIQ